MASTDASKGAKGISAFVVHKDDSGLSVGPKERKLGIKGSPTSEIAFADYRIPADRLIGEEGMGFITALKTLDHTRSMIGAQAVGIAQGALDASIACMKERRQFGRAIAEFQGCSSCCLCAWIRFGSRLCASRASPAGTRTRGGRASRAQPARRRLSLPP